MVYLINKRRDKNGREIQEKDSWRWNRKKMHLFVRNLMSTDWFASATTERQKVIASASFKHTQKAAKLLSCQTQVYTFTFYSHCTIKHTLTKMGRKGIVLWCVFQMKRSVKMLIVNELHCTVNSGLVWVFVKHLIILNLATYFGQAEAITHIGVIHYVSLWFTTKSWLQCRSTPSPQSEPVLTILRTGTLKCSYFVFLATLHKAIMFQFHQL